VAEYVEEEEEEVEAYWDEETGYTFDDDMYDNAYWNYDWSSVWGEYGYVVSFRVSDWACVYLFSSRVRCDLPPLADIRCPVSHGSLCLLLALLCYQTKHNKNDRCTDLFETDMEGYNYDSSVPPGGTDDWPFINIYGSCKTCDAYILDYFAEEAFERVDGYKKQAIFYLSCSIWGLGAAFLLYLKFRASPAAENEVELLSNDGGVIA
jgi:hypothetical protein